MWHFRTIKKVDPTPFERKTKNKEETLVYKKKESANALFSRFFKFWYKWLTPNFNTHSKKKKETIFKHLSLIENKLLHYSLWSIQRKSVLIY